MGTDELLSASLHLGGNAGLPAAGPFQNLKLTDPKRQATVTKSVIFALHTGKVSHKKPD